MNKVTLNGKIPQKRVNLKSVDSTKWHENFLPERMNTLLLNQDGKIICLGNSYAIWEKEFGKPWTQTGRLVLSNINMFFIQDGIKYAVKNKTEWGTYDNYIVEVYKIENGVATLLSKTYQHSMGTETFDAQIYLKNEIYARGEIYNTSRYKYFKSKDFGVTWTEITNQITNNTDKDIKKLFTYPNKINVNDVTYIFYETDILKFDGETFDVFKKDANINWYKQTVDFTNRSSAYILDIKHIRQNYGYKSEFTFCRLEKNNLNGIDINKEKSFIYYEPNPNFINTKDFTCYLSEGGDETGLCYKEFPVTAYIEDREKG